MAGRIKESPLLDHVSTQDLEDHAYRIEVLEQAFDEDIINSEQLQSALRRDRITYTNKRMDEGQDTLQINDLVFSMPRITTPPVAIRIDKQNLNYSWQTLRTKASAKVPSGHGNTRISFSLYFVGKHAINAGLRRLLACFEATPFVFIENRFIRENLSPGSLVSGRDTGEILYESMAASLLNLSVHTEPGLANVLVADVDLLWFNYKPYSPNFWFRQSWEPTDELHPLKDFGKPADEARPAKVSVGGDSKAEGTGILIDDAPVYSVPLDPDLPLTKASPPVMYPEFSEPLQKRIKTAERNFSVVSSLHSGITFRYWTYETLSSAEKEFAKNQFLKPEVVRDLDETHLRGNPKYDNPPSLKLQNQAADALEELAKAFYNKWDTTLTVNSCFRTRDEQQRMRKNSKYDAETGTYVAAEWSWHETGLAVDLATRGNDMDYDKWKWLVKNAPKYGFSNLGLRMAKSRGKIERFWAGATGSESTDKDDVILNLARRLANTGVTEAIKKIKNKMQYATFTESWHFDYLEGQRNAKAEAISSYPTRSDKSLSVTQFTIKNVAASLYIHEKGTENKEITDSLQKTLEERRPGKTPWLVDNSSSSSFIVFKRREELIIDEDDKELVPQSIAISKHNMIAQLPVIGHEFATQQYLGSTDMDAVITFVAVKGKKLALLQKMNAILQANGRGSRQTRDAAAIHVYGNPIFDLLGFESGLIESISVQSIPGSPELYNVVMQVTEYKRTVPPDLTQEYDIKVEGHEQLFAETFYKAMIYSTGFFDPTSASGIQGVEGAAPGAKVQGITPGNTIALLKKTDSVPVPILGFFNKAAKLEETMLNRYRGTNGPTDLVSSRAMPSEIADEAGLSEDIERDEWLIQHLYSMQLPYIVFGNKEDPRKSAVATSIVRNSYNGRDKGEGYEASWQRVLGIYSAALMIILLRKKVSVEVLELLGIPPGLMPEDVELYYENTLTGNDLKEELILYDELKTIMRGAARIIVRDRLVTHPIFRHLYHSQQSILRRYTEGLAAYPDLDLPAHPATNSVLDTDPDYYFYNPASLQSSRGGGLKKLIIDKAINIAENTYQSFGLHCSKKAYDRDVMSFNKYAINNVEYRITGDHGVEGTEASAIQALRDYTGDFEAAVIKEEKRAAAAFIHDGDLALKNGFRVKSDRSQVIDNIIQQSNPLSPFQKSQNRSNVDEVKFGERSGGVVKQKPRKDQGASSLKDLIESSWAVFDDTTFKMARAFPTFKLYFIEDDSVEETYQIKSIRNFDDFYSYSAIKDIRIIRSRKIPADLCVISISNINGELDLLQYSSTDSNGLSPQRVVEKFDPSTVDTNQENPFEKLVVVEGSKIQLRLGYSTSPNKLETVFNGQVVEVALSPVSPDIVQLVCQSYATELVAELKGTEGKKEVYESTQELLSTMICSPEVKHFGRWSKNAMYDPKAMRTTFSGRSGRGVIDSFIEKQKWAWLKEDTFLNKPQDDNIYAPDFDDYADGWKAYDSALDWIGMKDLADWLNIYKDDRQYHPYFNTIWDIFQEMTLRHPGFIASAVPYGQRYTMFFGPPSQRYWSRAMTLDEEKRALEAEDWAKRYLSYDNRRTTAGQSTLVDIARWVGKMPEAVQSVEEKIRQRHAEAIKHEAYGRHERFKPFRSYWTLTSENHILANNIRVSSHGTFNAINLTYFGDPKGYKLQMAGQNIGAGVTTASIAEAIEDEAETLKMKADDNIEDKDTRVMMAEYFSCYGDMFARRYCAALLMQSLRDIYKGEIVITGNPKIKPYDVCYVYDSYNDIFGPVEVEQVTHIFSQETGFITEIKPDLIVSHNDWTSQSTLDAMQVVTSELAKKAGEYLGMGTTETMILGGLTAGLASGSIGLGILLLGGYKFVQWTQERQPLVITPLIKRHKPLLGGVDGFKFDDSFSNLAGKWERWKSDFEDGYEAFRNSAPFQKWYQEWRAGIVA